MINIILLSLIFTLFFSPFLFYLIKKSNKPEFLKKMSWRERHIPLIYIMETFFVLFFVFSALKNKLHFFSEFISMDIFKNPLLNGWLTLLGSIIGVLGAYLIMRIQIKETYIYGSVKNLPSKINKLKMQHDVLKASIFGLVSVADNDLTKIEKIDENKINTVENIISTINSIELPNTKNFNEISGNIDIIKIALMMINDNESDVRDLTLDGKIEVIRQSFNKNDKIINSLLKKYVNIK